MFFTWLEIRGADSPAACPGPLDCGRILKLRIPIITEFKKLYVDGEPLEADKTYQPAISRNREFRSILAASGSISEELMGTFTVI